MKMKRNEQTVISQHEAINADKMKNKLIVFKFVSTSEFAIPSRTIILQGLVSDVCMLDVCMYVPVLFSRWDYSLMLQAEAGIFCGSLLCKSTLTCPFGQQCV